MAGRRNSYIDPFPRADGLCRIQTRSFNYDTSQNRFSHSRSRPASSCWRWSPGWTFTLSACTFAAAAIVLAVAFVFFSQGWIGGGDAKLAAETYPPCGSAFAYPLDYLLYAFHVFGGVLTLALLQFCKLPLPGVSFSARPGSCACNDRAGDVPYGHSARSRSSARGLSRQNRLDDR